MALTNKTRDNVKQTRYLSNKFMTVSVRDKIRPDWIAAYYVGGGIKTTGMGILVGAAVMGAPITAGLIFGAMATWAMGWATQIQIWASSAQAVRIKRQFLRMV